MAETHYTEWFRFRSGALPETAFHVIRFSGTEGLNTLFSLTIELASRNADIDGEAVLAAEAEFAILRADEPPALFRGFPTRFDQGGHFGGYTFYTVELRPAFWKLTRIVGSAVFLNKKIREAAAEVLRTQQFFHFEHEFRLTRDYPAPEFSMQYGESFYDYVLFRAEEQGVYFYFAPDGDRIIFADAPESHGKPSVTLAYSPASGLDHVRWEEVLQNFTLSRTPLSRQVVVRCYDWKDPNRVIVGRAEVSANGMGDVYLAGEHAESQEQADRLAKIRAEELVCRSRVFTGSGSVPVLRPGVVFSLTDHYSASFNRDYMVTEISHEGSQEAFISLGLGIPMQDAEDHYFYRNSFTCIPSDVPYRPARTAPRAKIPGVIRAFVDGAQNRRAEMDEYGRYKLIFPFDISGRGGGNASCWIRMAGPQTGKDSGLAFPLLPGTEVVVSFIDGDPDRPVITGSLPNGETGSIVGRGNPNVSGIRTTGGNQITINDTDKKQGISLTTPAGLGYHMGSGSPGTLAEVGDVKLQAASVGCTEIGGAFKSIATGFKVSQKAEKSDKQAWIVAALNAFFGAAGKTADSLSEKASDAQTKDIAGLVADAAKSIALWPPVYDEIKSATDASAAPYGAILSAKKDAAKSTLQVNPSIAELIASIALWMSPRFAGAGISVADGIIQAEEDQQDYQHSKWLKKQFGEAHDALTTLQTTYGEDSAWKDNVQIPEKSFSEQNLKDIRTALEKAIAYFENKRKPLSKADQKNLDELKAMTWLARAASELDRLKEKGLLDKDNLAFLGDANYNRNAVHRAAKSCLVSPLAELLPEITASVMMIVANYKLKKSLVDGGIGGVSLASEDSNVNIRAAEPVSVHSQGGILLDTKLGLNGPRNGASRAVSRTRGRKTSIPSALPPSGTGRMRRSRAK